MCRFLNDFVALRLHSKRYMTNLYVTIYRLAFSRQNGPFVKNLGTVLLALFLAFLSSAQADPIIVPPLMSVDLQRPKIFYVLGANPLAQSQHFDRALYLVERLVKGDLSEPQIAERMAAFKLSVDEMQVARAIYNLCYGRADSHLTEIVQNAASHFAVSYNELATRALSIQDQKNRLVVLREIARLAPDAYSPEGWQQVMKKEIENFKRDFKAPAEQAIEPDAKNPFVLRAIGQIENKYSVALLLNEFATESTEVSLSTMIDEWLLQDAYFITKSMVADQTAFGRDTISIGNRTIKVSSDMRDTLARKIKGTQAAVLDLFRLFSARAPQANLAHRIFVYTINYISRSGITPGTQLIKGFAHDFEFLYDLGLIAAEHLGTKPNSIAIYFNEQPWDSQLDSEGRTLIVYFLSGLLQRYSELHSTEIEPAHLVEIEKQFETAFKMYLVHKIQGSGLYSKALSHHFAQDQRLIKQFVDHFGIVTAGSVLAKIAELQMHTYRVENLTTYHSLLMSEIYYYIFQWMNDFDEITRLRQSMDLLVKMTKGALSGKTGFHVVVKQALERVAHNYRELGYDYVYSSWLTRLELKPKDPHAHAENIRNLLAVHAWVLSITPDAAAKKNLERALNAHLKAIVNVGVDNTELIYINEGAEMALNLLRERLSGNEFQGFVKILAYDIKRTILPTVTTEYARNKRTILSLVVRYADSLTSQAKAAPCGRLLSETPLPITAKPLPDDNIYWPGM